MVEFLLLLLVLAIPAAIFIAVRAGLAELPGVVVGAFEIAELSAFV
jgi:hypothetical protein